jgi:branched-chain amino acid transport system permease protein
MSRAFVVTWLVTMAALPLLVDSYWLNMLTLALIYSLAVFSINVLTGYAGLLSFGQAAFVGLGAYTYGILSVHGVSPAAAALAGVTLPTAAGVLLALPAARLKGQYLAIGTLGFGVLIGQALNNMVGVTRGPMGLIGIHSIGLDRTGWFYGMLVTSAGIMLGLDMLERHTYLGLVLKSIKYDETSARACGVGVFPVKLFAFAVSALLAGTCGVLLAAYMRFLTPDLFGTAESFRYLMMAVVGGVGSAAGGLLAALVLTIVPEGLRRLGESNVRLLVYGTMVLLVLWFLPQGIGGLIERVRWPRPGAHP